MNDSVSKKKEAGDSFRRLSGPTACSLVADLETKLGLWGSLGLVQRDRAGLSTERTFFSISDPKIAAFWEECQREGEVMALTGISASGDHTRVSWQDPLYKQHTPRLGPLGDPNLTVRGGESLIFKGKIVSPQNNAPNTTATDQAVDKSVQSMATIDVELSYTANWQQELVLRQTFKASHEVTSTFSQGVIFPITRQAYERWCDQGIPDFLNASYLSTLTWKEKAKKAYSGVAYPTLLSGVSDEFSKQQLELAEGLWTEPVALLGLAAGDLLGFADAEAPSGTLQLLSNAFNLYWQVRLYNGSAYLFLDPHSLLYQRAVMNSLRGVDKLVTWTLRSKYPYRMITLYRWVGS